MNTTDNPQHNNPARPDPARLVPDPARLMPEPQERPEPGPGEVLIEVAASGVNFIDVYQREGIYPLPTPFTLGMEGAGRVLAVGADVEQVTPGQVVAWAMTNGSAATYAVVPARTCVPVPDGVDHSLRIVYPLQFLVIVADVQAGPVLDGPALNRQLLHDGL